MRLLQSIPAREDLVVTLNRRPNSPILDEITWRHPLFTREGEVAKSHWNEVNRGPVVFAGAYWRNGFHEDGLVSGYAAARALGEEIP
jgi:predicted NAD/FAD-binding protein